ncbi:hypothetical protein ACFCT7_13625 [Fulvivirgaceae bacterium LMO-SS25]
MKKNKMIREVLVLMMLTIAISAKGQMNFQDSSVQVISYWDLGEQYEYAVSLQKLKYTETDTTSNETITYDVEVSVIDSTKNSYTIRWFYKNFKSDSKNPIVKKLAALAEDIAVDIKTDELGVIQSVENWEEVRDYMAISLDSLKRDYSGIPGMDKVFEQMEGMYSTKSAIEASSIQDVQQFHNFNGGKFILNETVTGQLKTSNLFEIDKPFDTEVIVTLEELDADNNQYVIRSIQEVNSEQLTETTYNYLKRMNDELGQEFIEREKFMSLKNTVETVSRIHNTGWVLESILWKEVFADGTSSMEIRRIEMK